MDLRAFPFAALTVLALPALLGGCHRPTHDPARLRAIRADAAFLLAHRPIPPARRWVTIPNDRLPPAIAGLHPYDVTLFDWGVDILIKPDFDGGWGYDIPRDPRVLPMPARCYVQPGPGVFWHGPC